MADDLTTRFLFKQFAGLTGADNDAKIDRIISAVSDAIALRCDRTFLLTTYRRWFNGTGAATMTLPEWPITRLYAISTESDDVLQIKNTVAEHAQVTADETGLKLMAIAAGVEAEQTVAFADQVTVTALDSAIDALGAGWSSAMSSGAENRPSNQIRPLYGVWAVSPNTADLYVAGDTSPARIVEGTDRAVELDGMRVFPHGKHNVFAWYQAGYALPADAAGSADIETVGTVPRDLTEIANRMTKAVLDASTQSAGGLKSERIGDYQYAISEGGRGIIATMLDECNAALAPHRSYRVQA